VGGNNLDDGWLTVETTILGVSTAEGYRVEIRGDQLTFTDLTGRPLAEPTRKAAMMLLAWCDIKQTGFKIMSKHVGSRWFPLTKTPTLN